MNNENGSKLNLKMNENIGGYGGFKMSNDRFGWKIRTTLGPIISRTKCDRDNKPILFCSKKESIRLRLA